MLSFACSSGIIARVPSLYKQFDKTLSISYYAAHMQNVPLILASTSPRRRELITLFGLELNFLSADIDEAPIPGEEPDELVWRLSRAKAAIAVRRSVPDAIIIGADTDVAIDGAILGKPADAADATRMLKLLRGRAHVVYSGVTVAQGARQVTQIVKTTVFMRDYSDAEIAGYVATGDPLDKAAAYAIQHDTFHPVERHRCVRQRRDQRRAAGENEYHQNE